MRLLLRTLLIAVLVIPGLSHAAPAPGFTLDVHGGGKVSLSELKGKVVLMDFWATWCQPCRQSFPWMNEMLDKYSDQGLHIVAVSLDVNPRMVEKFLHRYPAKFQIGLDPHGKVADQYNVHVMPTSYLIDRNGGIHKVHRGFRLSDTPALEKMIQDALKL